MALTPGQLEIVSSLVHDDIPFKLRCATCNKLALNAYRLPCCEQSICESCQQTLPENCPVCDHSPLSADLCKPNKALRTTIRVYLRTEEKKREKIVPPVQQTVVKTEDVAGTTPVGQNGGNEEVKTESVDVTGAGNSVDVGNVTKENGIKPEELVNGEATKSETIEDVNNAQQTTEVVATQEKVASQPRESSKEGSQEKAKENMGANGGTVQAQASPNTMGMDFTNVFNGMGYANQPDYTAQMMQMMASGGMGPNPMANFQNMMGMPGFGMDPMSQMYGGFGNMGMNMNNGMSSMNGMNFPAGQGMYGSWNGQNNMWNGQVNNNPNAFPNSMGNFGQNSGYGYNMSQQSGNFSQTHQQQQQYPNHDYQQGYQRPYGRGRGRGRGYDNYGNRGRGGYGQQQNQQYNQGYQGNHQAQQNQYQQQQQWQQQNGARQRSTPNRSTSPAETVIITDTIVPLSMRMTQTVEEDEAFESIEDQPENEEDSPPKGEDQESVKPEAEKRVSSPVKDAPVPEQIKEEVTEEKSDVTNEENHIQPVRSVLDDDIAQNDTPPLHTEFMPYTEDPSQNGTSVMAPPIAPAGPAAQFIGDTWDTNVRGRGSARAPYRGAARGRGSFSNGSITSPPRNLASDFPILTVVESKGLGVAGAPTGPKAMREGFPGAGRGVNIRGSAAVSSIPTGPKIPEQDKSESRDRYRDRDDSRSRSRSRSRSPSRHQSRKHHHRRRRSPSVSDTELEREKRRERKARRSRRDDDPEQVVQDEYHQASRASTPESRIPSRDEQEKERRSSHKHRSSHRSHRHRSRRRERRGDKTPLTPLENGAENLKNGDYVKEERQVERSSRHTEKERSKRGREEEDYEQKSHDHKRSRREEPEHEEKSADRKRSRREDDDYEEKSLDNKRSGRDRSHTPEDSGRSSHRESKRQKQVPEPEIPKGPRQKPFEQKAYEQKSYEKPAEPQKDPHTLEREARNRERMQKEQQRRNALSGTGRDNRGPKRRESKQSEGGNRRMSYKYEEDDGHARATRVEEEREAARWN